MVVLVTSTSNWLLWLSPVAVPFSVVLDPFAGKVLSAVAVAGAQLGCLLLPFENGQTVFAAVVAFGALKKAPTEHVVVLQSRAAHCVRDADPPGGGAGDDGVDGDGRVDRRPADLNAPFHHFTVFRALTVAVYQIVALFRGDQCDEGVLTAHVTAVCFATDQTGALCHVAEEGLSTSRSGSKMKKEKEVKVKKLVRKKTMGFVNSQSRSGD